MSFGRNCRAIHQFLPLGTLEHWSQHVVCSLLGGSGFLFPDFAISSTNGLEVAVPYYWRIAPNRDFTVTPHIYTKSLPAIEGRYRALTSLGAFQAACQAGYGVELDIQLSADGEAMVFHDDDLKRMTGAEGRA